MNSTAPRQLHPTTPPVEYATTPMDAQQGGAPQQLPAPAVDPPGVSEDVRTTDVFQDSVPVSALPPDRRNGRAAIEKEREQPARGNEQSGRPVLKSAVRRPERVREPTPAPAANLEDWAKAELSFSRVEPVAQPKAKSALAREIGGAPVKCPVSLSPFRFLSGCAPLSLARAPPSTAAPNQLYGRRAPPIQSFVQELAYTLALVCA